MQPFPQNTGPDEGTSSVARRRLGIVIGVAVLLGAGAWGVHKISGSGKVAPRLDQITLVSVPPPPPPPATPPPAKLPEPEPEREKMIAQEPVNEPEQKPEDQKPPEEPPVGTNIQGNGGPDAFGLSGKGGNGFSQGGSGPKKQGWGWYAGQVQTRIAELLRNNRKTRAARFEQLEVRIWLDATGRIQRASLVGSTGNASLDEAIKTEVLPGAQLSEPPPAGMPLSIKLRMKGIRPN